MSSLPHLNLDFRKRQKIRGVCLNSYNESSKNPKLCSDLRNKKKVEMKVLVRLMKFSYYERKEFH